MFLKKITFELIKNYLNMIWRQISQEIKKKGQDM